MVILCFFKDRVVWEYFQMAQIIPYKGGGYMGVGGDLLSTYILTGMILQVQTLTEFACRGSIKKIFLHVTDACGASVRYMRMNDYCTRYCTHSTSGSGGIFCWGDLNSQDWTMESRRVFFVAHMESQQIAWNTKDGFSLSILFHWSIFQDPCLNFRGVDLYSNLLAN